MTKETRENIARILGVASILMGVFKEDDLMVATVTLIVAMVFLKD